MLTGQYTKPSDFEEGDFRRINPRFSEEVCIVSIPSLAWNLQCNNRPLIFLYPHRISLKTFVLHRHYGKSLNASHARRDSSHSLGCLHRIR
jgi:hypothetical protein